MESSVVNIIIIVFLAASVLTGLHRGILKSGRWALGIVMGLFAVPVVSPVVESALKQSGIMSVFPSGNPALTAVSSYSLRFIVFSLSATLVKTAVHYFTDVDLPDGAKKVDKAAGAVFAVIKMFLFIWIFEWLLTASKTPVAVHLHQILLKSPLYTFIISFNLLDRLS